MNKTAGKLYFNLMNIFRPAVVSRQDARKQSRKRLLAS